MFLGIDLGTSAVKALVVGEDGSVISTAQAPLDVSRPQPLWSEQDPEDWWRAVEAAVGDLSAQGATAGVRAIGLSGQMHGATFLDAADQPLRPAILWNDGRSAEACRTLEAKEPASRRITGNLAMPGFTAPKLLWLREHEPEVAAKVRRVLLPKDYVRLRMTGEAISDCSDASGTLWLDVARRAWSDEMLAACGLDKAAMPALVEGSAEGGRLRPEVAQAWGMDVLPVAGGAGDQAAGAVGAGVIDPGRASLSLGTSGVLFAADDTFRPNPERAAHGFCHALPQRWHQMSVILSAASCLTWVTKATGARHEAALLAEIEQADRFDPRLLFLPYLSGERTPHNDPEATGVFVGLSHESDRAALGRAVLEGVAFAFADAQDVLIEAGACLDEVAVIGGGARSPLWGRILASALGRPLVYRDAAEVGPALGAARLGQLCLGEASPHEVCTPPPERLTIEPDASMADALAPKLAAFRDTYRRLRTND
ncbi:MAG: xylulokinase [Deltaproteobacteria bacterium]|jgi:xylulokinase|nr:xylulokinase [Deltaproteobacteria bacterium]